MCPFMRIERGPVSERFPAAGHRAGERVRLAVTARDMDAVRVLRRKREFTLFDAFRAENCALATLLADGGFIDVVVELFAVREEVVAPGAGEALARRVVGARVLFQTAHVEEHDFAGVALVARLLAGTPVRVGGPLEDGGERFGAVGAGEGGKRVGAREPGEVDDAELFLTVGGIVERGRGEGREGRRRSSGQDLGEEGVE